MLEEENLEGCERGSLWPFFLNGCDGWGGTFFQHCWVRVALRFHLEEVTLFGDFEECVVSATMSKSNQIVSKLYDVDIDVPSLIAYWQVGGQRV